MTIEKLKLDKPYPALAIELVSRFKSQCDEALWERWIDLERQNEGVAEISNQLIAFLRRNVEGPSHRDLRNLEVEMRRLVYLEAGGTPKDD